MTRNAAVGAGVLLLAGLAAVLYFIFGRDKEKSTEPVKPVDEYYEGKDEAADIGGVVGVMSFCAEQWGSSGQFYDACIDREHNKMLAEIANHNYSGCVTAYKRCHRIPVDGWKGGADGGEQYEFCQNAIINYREHVSPVIVEIVEQGAKIIVSPESARTRDKEIIHPDAYGWITNNTECTDLSCTHYTKYAIGWQDARINGYSESDSQFYDKVMEFAGMKKKWFGRGWTW